jgi:hypothetical protein
MQQLTPKDKETRLGLIAMIEELSAIIIGEPDETDLDNPTLIELCYAVDTEGKILVQDFKVFMDKHKKITGILNEMEVYLRRLGGYKADLYNYKR